MKKAILTTLTLIFIGSAIAGPADKVIIKNSKIENKTAIKRLRVKAVGKNQNISVGSFKIKKGTRIENAKIKNKTVIKDADIDVRGSGQNIDVGNFEISK